MTTYLAREIGKKGSGRYSRLPCLLCGTDRWVEIVCGKPKSSVCYSCKALWRMTRRSAASRFWEKVSKTEGCWLWNGAHSKDGYGQLCYGGKNISAHRLSWLLRYGKIPDGLQVLHNCDNPRCVNPEHLFTGTQFDNIGDMDRKHRRNILKGEDHYNARLNPTQVLEIRQSTLNSFELANIYGVTSGHIRSLKSNHKWKHQGSED